MPLVLSALACVAFAGLLPTRQEAAHAEVRAAVERFFAAQEAEDVDGYFALWSAKAQRPDPKSLKFIFDSGDDTFSNITILKVTPSGDGVRVRVSVTRARTDTRTLSADGTPRTFNTTFTTSLTFVREPDGLKLLNEGTPADDLAVALIGAESAAAREALLAAEADLVNDRLIYALSRRADVLAQAQKFLDAEPIYLRVYEVATRMNDPKAQGQALQNLGNSQWFRRDFAAALTSFQQRLAIERVAGNQDGIAASLVAIATIRYSTYEYADALGVYREALAMYEKLADETGIATTLVSTGNVLYLQGDYEAAAADYRRSRDLHRKTFNTSGEARALEGLGRTLGAQGDLAGALEAFTGVLAEWKARKVPASQATAAQSIGEVHFRLGNLGAARASFEESRLLFEVVKDLEAVGQSWQAIALTDLVATRFADAEKEYGESIAACTAAGAPLCIARAIVGLAFAQASQEKFDTAIVSYGKGIEAFAKLDRPVEAARAEVGLSQAHFGRKDFASALSAAARAQAAAIGQRQDDVLWRALVAEARAQRALAAPGKALAAATGAVEAVGRLWEAARLRPTNRVPADSTAAYAVLALLHAESGAAVQAFETLEAQRALALRLSLATIERQIARGMTPEERLDERAAAAELVSLTVRLDQERSLPKPDTARIDRLQESAAAAAAKRHALEQRLYDRLPLLRTWRGLAPPAGVGALTPLLTNGDVLVSFAIDEHDLIVATAAGRDDGDPDVRAYVIPVKRQKLAELVAAATRPEVLRNTAEWRRTAADVASLLPPPVLDRIASAPRAIVAPDDVLWRMPFEALPYKAGALGDKTPIAYAGSFSSLIAPREPRDGQEGPALLAVKAAELPDAMRERVKATAPGWVLRDTAAAGAEVDRLVASFEDETATALGPEDSEAAFRAQAATAAWLHVAAPFRVNGASPMFSPVLFAAGAAGGASEDDGALQAREIMNLDLRARAVVLSDPAAASMRDGAAAMPVVAWAWRAAGVPVVLLPRWPIDPASQNDFLAEFYRRLSAGDTVDAALHGARAFLRAREASGAPHAWAAWTIVGLPR